MKKQKTDKPIYKKWWFWLIVIFVIGAVVEMIERPGERKAYRQAIENVDLSDTANAILILDSLYQSDILPDSDDEFMTLKDSAKSLMLSLEYDPDYVELEKEKMSEELRSEKISEGIKKAVNPWDGSLRPLVKAVKQNMHDPKSFEHVKTEVLGNAKEDDAVVIVAMSCLV